MEEYRGVEVGGEWGERKVEREMGAIRKTSVQLKNQAAEQ